MFDETLSTILCPVGWLVEPRFPSAIFHTFLFLLFYFYNNKDDEDFGTCVTTLFKYQISFFAIYFGNIGD